VNAAHSRALNYSSYLRLDELLAAQRPRSEEHDELLFIVIHQVYELWFKQLLHELGGLQRWLEGGEGSRALHTLRRVRAILKTVVAQIDVLETMTPLEFAGFRGRLESASGFQSAQFRELEAVLGRRDRSVLSAYPPASDALCADRRGARPAVGLRVVRGVPGRPRLRARCAARRVPRRRRAGADVRGARRRRRGRAGVALPAREDGRAHDRRAAGHGRLGRRGVPPVDALPSVFPDLWAIRSEM